MSGGFSDHAVADATNVLVVASALDDADEHLCRDVLLADGSAPDRVLGVTIATSPEAKLSTWQNHLGTDPTYDFVSVDGAARSAASPAADVPGPDGPTVDRVDGVTPLDVLGTTVADHVEAGTAVCFDSITDLLEYVDEQTAFRFLHVLTSRVRTGGATAHFHIDGGAHDTETIALLSRLFDVVVEAGDDRSERE
ncbi:DUF7504 family protein [Halomicrobium salinisoli]|uniref:DUF7504 family protein n=1 Tax=Halomicrobium salinisoli TaxID=2878391 RepID=UPI001CF02244|nr:hypothetical protein [Halomicrobium salinisoli]